MTLLIGPPTPRPYVRRNDLPHLVHVPRSWLSQSSPRVGNEICRRLEHALDDAQLEKNRARERALTRALQAERQRLKA